jgi:hypothetical protein
MADSTLSLQFLLDARAAYFSGKTVRCALLTGATVARTADKGYRSAYAADIAAGVPTATVTPSSTANTGASPQRIQTTFTDATIAVPGGTADIVGCLYYVDTGLDTTDTVLHIGPLSSPVVIDTGGNTVIIRAGSDGVMHGRALVTAT